MKRSSTKKKDIIPRKKTVTTHPVKKVVKKKYPKKKITGKNQSVEKTSESFPVVGIGGSAGGMEAFSRLVSSLPNSLGMAYVYVQHLSSAHSSMLPEILQRKTSMQVLKAENGVVVKKDHVYVIPSKGHLTISEGRFRLEKRLKETSPNSIDTFLQSLAEEYGPNGIAVILSGTGTDGVIGAMAVKTSGGVTFAQDKTAAHEGMPVHAAELGYIDFVMPPEKIAGELAALIQHPFSVLTAEQFLDEHAPSLKKIFMLLHQRMGVDFSYYKQTTIHRRIIRRMVLNHFDDLEAYARMVKENKNELHALYHDLLISVTAFFRDPQMYQALSSKILPDLFRNGRIADPLRIWVPGCATGEEAVSFAIILLEFLGEKALSTQIQIFSTDLNERAISRARSGIYPKNAVANVSPQRLRKYFTEIDGHYQVIKTIRDMCIFAAHNLLRNPPFSKMDIISCQNVLIYLEPMSQTKVLNSFHYALKPDGYLLLGKSETIGTASNLFRQPDKHYKMFTKKKVRSQIRPDLAPPSYPPMDPQQENRGFPALVKLRDPDIEKETDKLLLTRFVPASVLVNKDLEIVRFRGQTSKYLEPASGKASLHVLKMIREDLVLDLRSVLYRARKEGKPTRKDGIPFEKNGNEIAIDAIPLRLNGDEPYFLLIFTENHVPEISIDKKKKTPANNATARIIGLENQLKEARESIRSITEDFESTREELQSANEEILSSNEELQSINEELETSKEELQSTNEELTTINEELHTRNQELKQAGEYATAIIETMHESLVILTGDLKVKKANKGFYRTFKVGTPDSEGYELFGHDGHRWNIPELRKQIEMVRTQNKPFTNLEVSHDFPGLGHRVMLINAHPFHIREESESMILLAIQDITENKKMEVLTKENEEKLQLLIENASDIITVLDKEGTIRYESPAVKTILGYEPDERIGKNISNDIVHPDDTEKKLILLKKSINAPQENILGEFRLRHRNGTYRNIEAVFRNMTADKKINGIIATYRDITDRKLLENQKDEFIGVASHELKTPVTSIKAYAQILEDIFRKANDRNAANLLAKMNTQIDRLATLIVDLLDFTRIEGGKLKFRKEEYHVNDLIREISEEIQRTSKLHKIEFKPGKAIKATGDRFRTGQVLTNLLSNAIKYSPDAKKIIVTSTVEKQEVTICVRDFGIGIDPSLRDKVFNRFFRVTETKLNTFPGLGLGLYIAAEFVKRQGGRIWVNPVKGKGSEFCFTIPLNKKP